LQAHDPDFIVIGSGTNGLVAACTLARSGMQVLVLERSPRRPGAELSSEQLTLPSFIHDLGPGFFPFARTSPALVELELERHGVTWLNADVESCHLARDGSRACLYRNAEARGRVLGGSRNQDAWRALGRRHARIEPELHELLLRPAPTWAAAHRLGATNLLSTLWTFSASAHRLAARLCGSEPAARIIPSLAALLGATPNQAGGGGYGYLLALAATTAGFAIPRGGAQSVANTLVSILERHGGRLRLGVEAEQVVVSQGRAVAVRLLGGDEIRTRRGILADTGPGTLRHLVRPSDRDAPTAGSRVGARSATGTFKVDWALTGPVPWQVDEASQSLVVTTADSVAALLRSHRRVQAGHLADPPWVTFVQPTVADSSRAPRNQHTLSGIVRVPLWTRDRWRQREQRFADDIEAHVEGLAPGFRRRILERHLAPPGSDISNGGLNGISPSLRVGLLRGVVRRWLSPGRPYRAGPIGLYLCSAATHPGPGWHGMSGHNAASIALRDLG
jgi:phytoene dehydrogenase-like protein